MLYLINKFITPDLLRQPNLSNKDKKSGGNSPMVLCITLGVFLWSCSSKEDKLPLAETPPVVIDSTPVDTRMDAKVFTELPPPPIVEKDNSLPARPTKKNRPSKKEKEKTVRNVTPETPAQIPVNPDINEDEVFIRAEQMPRFPGCERYRISEAEKAKCAEQKLFEYIRANLTYPPQALKNELQGEAMVKFIVDKEGNIGNVELLTDPGSGMGTAALNVIYNMSDLNIKWIPGRQQGKPVSVWFMLPIRFSLGEKNPAANK